MMGKNTKNGDGMVSPNRFLGAKGLALAASFVKLQPTIPHRHTTSFEAAEMADLTSF